MRVFGAGVTVFRAVVTGGENKQNMKGRAPPFPAYQLLTICLKTFFQPMSTNVGNFKLVQTSEPPSF